MIDRWFSSTAQARPAMGSWKLSGSTLSRGFHRRGRRRSFGDDTWPTSSTSPVEAIPQLHGPGVVEWLERLDAEADNLRSALEWGLETESEGAIRLADRVELLLEVAIRRDRKLWISWRGLRTWPGGSRDPRPMGPVNTTS